MPFFFDLVHPNLEKASPDGSHRVLDMGGVADHIPIAAGAAALHVADLIQLSILFLQYFDSI